MVRNRRSGAFTLIELLVVVAIISLLMSILLPSFGRAREQCKLVYCTNNMRSFWTGIMTYSLENQDRVPLMEDVNVENGVLGTGPDADPFDPAFPTTVGVVLKRFVNPKSWVCPAAVDGFPRVDGRGGWKMTYSFGVWPTGIGDVVPWDQYGGKIVAGSPADKTNYWVFDGRPLRKLDGRRYVRFGANENRVGKWNQRYPIIFDLVVNDSPSATGNGFVYPHRGALSKRNDLENWVDEFELKTRSDGASIGRNELYADWDRASILLTRVSEPHKPGY